jgi:hypothetical protein
MIKVQPAEWSNHRHAIPQLLAWSAWHEGLDFLSGELDYFMETRGRKRILPVDFPRLHECLRKALNAHIDIDPCCRSIEAMGELKFTSFWKTIMKSDPVRDFHTLKDRAADLKQDIKTTIKLWDLQVQRELSYDSKIQARRATTLTTLAAIYLPLTLTTGVFGMNIWEINGGTPRYWAVLALGIGTLLLSLPVLIWIFHYDYDEYRTLGRFVGDDKGRVDSGKERRSGTTRCGSVTAFAPNKVNNLRVGEC